MASTAYCTSADLFSFGVPTSTDSTIVTTCLDAASRIIDSYCGTAFNVGTGTPTTNTVFDVRTETVPLTRWGYLQPNSVTAVSINYSLQDATRYMIDYGFAGYLLLYYPGVFDVDGFVAKPFDDMWPRGGLPGSRVDVTATWGYPTVPSPVKNAAISLATRYAVRTRADLPPDQRVILMAVENFQARYNISENPRLDTTGDQQVDIDLLPYRTPSRVALVD